jgi:hypothetical protein
LITDVLVKIGPEVLPRLKAIAQANKKAEAVAAQVAKAAPAPAKEPRVTPLKGPAGLIEADLRGWFNTKDRNTDGKLDKAELAQALRGAGPKAVDFAPVGKDGKPLGAKDLVKFNDAAFLARVDRDGDGFVSRNEFEHWAQDFAQYQYELKKTQDEIAAAERRLNETKLTQAMRVQANLAIQASWANYHAARQRWAHLHWAHRHFVRLSAAAAAKAGKGK